MIEGVAVVVEAEEEDMEQEEEEDTEERTEEETLPMRELEQPHLPSKETRLT